MPPILNIINLSKHYGDLIAVDNISFSVNEGTCLGLLGPNGAGKTTTIEIIEGILSATSGEVHYRGVPLGNKFKQEAGIQFQSTALQDFLTVKETLELFSRLYDETVSIDELVETCALGDFLNRDNQRLSGGQRQRLLLAIALINNPKVVFLDEPTTGLDPQARRNFWQLIQSIKASHKTIILTTHYMEEASILCDDIVIMDNGKILVSGSPSQLLKDHFDDILVQLPIKDFQAINDPTVFETIERGDYVTIHSTNVHETLKILHQQNINLTHLEIRTRNLEDLFLELTGKDLRS